MLRIRIGVLMGGRSLESEVSFNSGRTICDHLDSHTYEILPFFQTHNGTLYLLPWKFLHRGKTTDFLDRLENEAEKISWSTLKERVDIIYPALHGRWGEDGTIQAVLETLKIPYVGSGVYTSALTASKKFHDELLNEHHIQTPKSLYIEPTKDLDGVDWKSFFVTLDCTSLVVKPDGEGSSFGVSIVKTEKELKAATHYARTIEPRIQQAVIIQEKIEGIEFSVTGILQNNAWHIFPPTEIVHQKTDYVYNYVDKYMPGSGKKYTPARFSQKNLEDIKKIAHRIAIILQARSCIRIDGFLKHDGTIVIIESNIFPGMTPASFTFWQSEEDNINPTQLINMIISESLSNDMILEHSSDKKSFQSKLRIAVLLGGGSAEKETSLDSGRNVIYKLSHNKYSVTPIFVTPENRLFIINTRLIVKNATHEIEEHLDTCTEISWDEIAKTHDFVFLALHGGEGENGCIQGMLEMLNMPYNGSGILASALCMDKHETKRILSREKISVPKGFLLSKNDYEHAITDSLLEKSFNDVLAQHSLSYPLIIKPHNDGCSCLVSCVHTAKEALESIKNVFDFGKDHCLIEECINAMELTVGVLGNDTPLVLPPTYTPKKDIVLSLEEKFLPGDGQNITPAPLSIEETIFIKETIARAYKALGCKGYARIDCFFKPGIGPQLIVLECNTLPALTPATCLFHQAAEIGMKPIELLEKIIELGLELHSKKMIPLPVTHPHVFHS